MKTNRLLIFLAALALLLAACGNGTTTETAESDPDAVDAALADDEQAPAEDSSAQDSAPENSAAENTTDEDSADEDSADEDNTDDANEQEQSPSTGGGTLGSSVLSGAVGDGNAPTSGRFEGSFDIVSTDPDMAGAFSMGFSGTFDTSQQASTMELDFGNLFETLAASDSENAAEMAIFGDAFTEPIEVITIGDEAWMRWGFFTIMGVDEGSWISTDDAGAGSLTEGFGFGFGGTTQNPADFLTQFEDANATIEELGTETVRGVETRHVRAVIDYAKLAETLPADERDEMLEGLGGIGGFDELPVEFWIGDNGFVYRFVIHMDLSDVPDNEGMESFTMTYEMYDYGANVGIEAPDPSNVVDGDSIGF
jgi:hypothetical protein